MSNFCYYKPYCDKRIYTGFFLWLEFSPSPLWSSFNSYSSTKTTLSSQKLNSRSRAAPGAGGTGEQMDGLGGAGALAYRRTTRIRKSKRVALRAGKGPDCLPSLVPQSPPNGR